jgi:hypothetical protein
MNYLQWQQIILVLDEQESKEQNLKTVECQNLLCTQFSLTVSWEESTMTVALLQAATIREVMNLYQL